jgi:hypothetical protein
MWYSIQEGEVAPQHPWRRHWSGAVGRACYEHEEAEIKWEDIEVSVNKKNAR